MKISVLFLLITVLPVYSKSRSIESYGVHGANTPSFLNKKPKDSFFVKSFTRAFAERNDYLAYMPKEYLESVSGEWFLVVDNPNESIVHLVVSSLKKEKNKNFLIEIPPESSLTVNMMSLRDCESLFFVSKLPVSMVSVSDGSEIEVTFEEPVPTFKSGKVRTLDNTDFCGLPTIDVVISSGSRYSPNRVLATISRFYRGDRLCDPYGFYEAQHSINVYWPDSSTIHHSGEGHYNSDCNRNTPECLRETYKTSQIQDGDLNPIENDFGNKLVWSYDKEHPCYEPSDRNLDIRFFDELLFFQKGFGKITCMETIQQRGQLCVNEPYSIWYVTVAKGLPCLK